MAIVKDGNYVGTGSIVPTGTSPAVDQTPQVPSAVPAPATPAPVLNNPDGSTNTQFGGGASGNTTGDPGYYSRYTPNETAADSYLNGSFQAPKTAEQIQQEKTTAAQAQIDALNRHYDSLLAEQKTVNEGRSRGTSSVNVLSGLAGSTEANATTTKTDQLNARDNEKIQAERNAAIQDIFFQIRSSAVQEAQQSRLEARQSAQDILAARTKRQEEATAHLTTLAQAGTTADGLKNTDPESYAFLVKQAGGESQLKAIMTLNRPKETILDKRVENGKYIIAYQNPLDGKVRMETVDLGLPSGSIQVADAGGYILFGQAGADGKWDGDMATTTKISKTLTPDQAADNQLQRDKLNAAGSTPTPGSIVDATGKPIKLTAPQVDALTGFDNTKQAAQSALDLLAKGVSTGPIAGNLLQGAKFFGTQDADQLKLEQTLAKIKADFMKAISGAAVSESEAARLSAFLPQITDQETVMKSKLEQLISESQRTKANMLATLGAAGSSSNEPSATSRVLVGPTGQSFDASSLSPEEYQQAIDDGYKAK